MQLSPFTGTLLELAAVQYVLCTGIDRLYACVCTVVIKIAEFLDFSTKIHPDLCIYFLTCK